MISKQLTHSLISLLLGAFLWAIQTGYPANAQTIQIVSPVNGAVVVPGQTVAITVSVGGGSFNSVQVIGKNIGITSLLTTPPFQFSLLVPSKGLIGLTTLIALGITGDEAGVFSQPVTINVLPTAALSALTMNFTAVTFGYVGQQIPLSVTGRFADGSRGDITSAPGISYVSNNTSVVSVGLNGLMTAAGGGNADVIVKYGSQTADVAVSVPVTIKGDLDGDGDVDLDDLNILRSALNSLATGPLDARDLNGDGIINAVDSRLLVNMCTRPRCAIK